MFITAQLNPNLNPTGMNIHIFKWHCHLYSAIPYQIYPNSLISDKTQKNNQIDFPSKYKNITKIQNCPEDKKGQQVSTKDIKISKFSKSYQKKLTKFVPA